MWEGIQYSLVLGTWGICSKAPNFLKGRELTVLVVGGQALVWPPSELDQETDLIC